jgi:hypothetical protein
MGRGSVVVEATCLRHVEGGDTPPIKWMLQRNFPALGSAVTKQTSYAIPGAGQRWRALRGADSGAGR